MEFQYRGGLRISFLWRFLADFRDFLPPGGGFPPTESPVFGTELLCNLRRPQVWSPVLPYQGKSPPVVLLLTEFQVSPPERSLPPPVVSLSVAELLRLGRSLSSGEKSLLFPPPLLSVEDSVGLEDRPGYKLPQFREEVEFTTEFLLLGGGVSKLVPESPRF